MFGTLIVDSSKPGSRKEALEIQRKLGESGFLHSICYVQGQTTPELVLASDEHEEDNSLLGAQAIEAFLQQHY